MLVRDSDSDRVGPRNKGYLLTTTDWSGQVGNRESTETKNNKSFLQKYQGCRDGTKSTETSKGLLVANQRVGGKGLGVKTSDWTDTLTIVPTFKGIEL